MRIISLIGCALALSGCAHFMNDQYAPALGSSAIATDAKTNARECRDEASDTYLWKQGHGLAVIGIVGGGSIGGAAGGAIAGGSLSAISTDKNSAPPTLDQMIQSCMQARGYTGFSEH